MSSVTICIPTYNGERYLRACLDSALAQTHADFELLLADDCSTDATLDIAREYAARDARIRIVSNERNAGLVGNWNRCIELTNAPWIKFLFQDDVLAPDCLAVMLHAADDGCLLVACDRSFIFDANTPSHVQAYYDNHRQFVRGLFKSAGTATPQQFAEFVVDHMGENLLGEPTSLLIHRRAFAQYGLFNPHLIQDCDFEYWARVGSNEGVKFVARELVQFRVHAQSTSALNQRRALRHRLDTVIMLHDMVYHPAYAKLRSAVARTRPAVNLEREFWTTAYEVLELAAARRKLTAAPTAAKNDLDSLLAAYPNLQSIPRKHAPRALARRVARQLYKISALRDS